MLSKGSRRRSEGQQEAMDEEEEVESNLLKLVGRGIERHTLKEQRSEEASISSAHEEECSAEVELKML